MSSTAVSASFAAGAIAPTRSFSVQHDWQTVLREFTTAKAAGGVHALPQESKQFWVSLSGEEDVHAVAKLEAKPAAATAGAGSSLAAAAKSVAARCDEFDLEFAGPLQLQAFHAGSGTKQLLQAPRSVFGHLHADGDVFAVDVNAAGTLGISGGRGGSLRTWDATSGTLTKDLVGHRGDIHLARFFPSGSVALSSGLDLVLRVWALDSGLEAARLPGHARPVTSVQFLERGRHLITAAEDGTAKLWDVGTQAALCSYPNRADHFAPKFNDAIVLDPTAHPLALDEKQNDLPDAATGNLLLTAGSDGIVRGFDLRAQGQVLMIPTGAAGGIESLAVGPTQHTFTLGSGEGAIGIIELRRKQPLFVLRQDDAAITNIRPWSEDSFWTTNSTGATNLWQLDASSGSVVAQLTGVDCEPVHDICLTSSAVYLSSHNAVRVYSLGALPRPGALADFHGLDIPTASQPAVTQ